MVFDQRSPGSGHLGPPPGVAQQHINKPREAGNVPRRGVRGSVRSERTGLSEVEAHEGKPERHILHPLDRGDDLFGVRFKPEIRGGQVGVGLLLVGPARKRHPSGDPQLGRQTLR